MSEDKSSKLPEENSEESDENSLPSEAKLSEKLSAVDKRNKSILKMFNCLCKKNVV